MEIPKELIYELENSPFALKRKQEARMLSRIHELEKRDAEIKARRRRDETPRQKRHRLIKEKK